MSATETSAEHIHVSVGELVRIAPDALRGLGFDHATADRASESLVWAEAIARKGLRFLRLCGEKIEAGTSQRFSVTQRRVGNLIVQEIDAAGKSLFESGPRAVDLANAEADRTGAGLVLLSNTAGLFMAGELVTRSAERGYPVLAILRSDGRGDEFEPDGALLGIPGRPPEILQTEAADVEGGVAGRLVAHFYNSWTRSVGDEEMIAADLQPFLARQEGTTSAIALACVTPRAEHEGLTGALASNWQPAGFAERWDRAVAHGLAIDLADWKALHAFVRRIRVPSSERSRSQAG